MENKAYYEDEIEIDLLRLLYALRDKIWWIVAAAVTAACCAIAITYFFITPSYESTSTILVLSKETTLTSLADLQLGSQLTQDYKVLITSRPVLQAVVDDLELDMNYKAFKSCIEITNPEDTRILKLTVTMPSPVLAKAAVDKLASEASEFIGDKMEVTPPKVIEEGEVPVTRSSPSYRKNAILGFVLGAVLVCGIVVVLELLNDSIMTEDDITRYLNLPTLAVVPERGGYEHSRTKKRMKKDRKAE